MGITWTQQKPKASSAYPLDPNARAVADRAALRSPGGLTTGVTGGKGSIALDAGQQMMGVFGGGAGAQEALRGALGGVQTTKTLTAVGPHGTTFAGTSRQPGVTPQDLAASSLADYNALVQTQEYNLKEAQKAFADLSKATEEMPEQVGEKVAASRGRMGAWTQEAKDAVAGTADRVKDVGEYLFAEAPKMWQDYQNRSENWLQEYKDMVGDRAAQYTMSLAVGAQQSYRRQKATFEQLVTSGSVGDPAALESIKKQIDGQYATSLGATLAQGAVGFHKIATEAMGAAYNYTLAHQAGMAQTTTAAVGAAGGLFARAAEIESAAANYVLTARSAHEQAMTQLEIMAEHANVDNRMNQALFRVSEPMRAQAVLITPLLESAYRMQQQEIAAANVAANAAANAARLKTQTPTQPAKPQVAAQPAGAAAGAAAVKPGAEAVVKPVAEVKPAAVPAPKAPAKRYVPQHAPPRSAGRVVNMPSVTDNGVTTTYNR